MLSFSNGKTVMHNLPIINYIIMNSLFSRCDLYIRSRPQTDQRLDESIAQHLNGKPARNTAANQPDVSVAVQ